MTDRELLELAAKGAGIDCKWLDDDFADHFATTDGMWLKGKRSPDNSIFWNPLTCDGDALRLAVKLKLAIHIDFDRIGVASDKGVIITEYLYDTPKTDPYAATRRAITRAAAEIGRGIK